VPALGRAGRSADDAPPGARPAAVSAPSLLRCTRGRRGPWCGRTVLPAAICRGPPNDCRNRGAGGRGGPRPQQAVPAPGSSRRCQRLPRAWVLWLGAAAARPCVACALQLPQRVRDDIAPGPPRPSPPSPGGGLQAASYPEDEAATPEKLDFRIRNGGQRARAAARRLSSAAWGCTRRSWGRTRSHAARLADACLAGGTPAALLGRGRLASTGKWASDCRLCVRATHLPGHSTRCRPSPSPQCLPGCQHQWRRRGRRG
jgi:hypothetical protein